MLKVQQGDVLLKAVKKTNFSKGKKLNHLVLAEGESTGHCHQVVSGVATLIMMQDKMFLKVMSDYAKLKHNTHNEILVPKGNYEVGIVVEQDHISNIVRRVVD